MEIDFERFCRGCRYSCFDGGRWQYCTVYIDTHGVLEPEPDGRGGLRQLYQRQAPQERRETGAAEKRWRVVQTMDKWILAVQTISAVLTVIVYGAPLILASEIVNRIIDWVAAIW